MTTIEKTKPAPHAATDISSADKLDENLLGQVLRRGSAGYDAARANWNGTVEQHPALIVRAEGTADVMSAVRFAEAQQLGVALKTTGHGALVPAGEEALLIDLSPMNAVRVDPKARAVRIEPAVTGRRLDHETGVFGLATPGPTVSSVGMAGFTLAGGFGQMIRKYGTTADNLLSADVILADGSLVTASAEENEDLFWAIRGGGGNFGVVVSFTYRLHEVSEVLGGSLIYPLDQAPDVLRFYRDFVRGAPDELTSYVSFMPADALPPPLEELRGERALVLGFCWAGDPAEGEEVLAPMRAYGSPAAGAIEVMPYPAFQALSDPMEEPGEFLEAGQENLWYGTYFEELSDGLIDVLVEEASNAESPLNYLAIEFIGGGAWGRADEGAMALSHRNARFDSNFRAFFRDLGRRAEVQRYIDTFVRKLRPFDLQAVALNYMAYEGEDRIRAAFSGYKYERLRRIKAKYDPENRFRYNANIKPGDGEED